MPLIKQLRKKKDVTNSNILEEIGASIHLNIRFLTIGQTQKPITTGIITYYPPLQSAQEAREKKTEQLIKNFAVSHQTFMHFICHLKESGIKHGFLISINRAQKQNPILNVFTDIYTQKLHKTVQLYINWINQYYHDTKCFSLTDLDPNITRAHSKIINSLLQMRLSDLGPITIEK